MKYLKGFNQIKVINKHGDGYFVNQTENQYNIGKIELKSAIKL